MNNRGVKKLMDSFDLVIFDCDGVLVDSERITNRVFCALLTDIGLTVSLEDMFTHFVGKSTGQCMAIITDMLGHPPPPGFFEHYHQEAELALRNEVVPVPGIEAALDAITLPTCVASSGEPEKIRLTLGTTGLLPRFENRIFSVRDVKNAKPAPDIYLLAAQQLGVSPARCAVVEDTPTGTTAGASAGMCVFGFAAYMAGSRLLEAGAYTTFKDMSELPKLIERGREATST